MADFDMGWDRLERVKEEAVAAIKDIMQLKVNDLQAPAWLQAADAIYQFNSLDLGCYEELEGIIYQIAELWDEDLAQHWSTQSDKYAEAMKQLLNDIHLTNSLPDMEGDANAIVRS